MQNNRILNSKLLVPGSPDVLERERLSAHLDPILQKRLALVIAGAGYGKSTLVSRWLREKGVPAIWYSLDRSDMDFTVFLQHLIQGFRNLCHSPVDIPLDLMSHAGTTHRWREAVLFRLANRIQDQLREDTMVVFDDYYRVQESREITEAMEFMLDRLPLSVHVILISRLEPGLRVSRLRAMRAVIDIGEGNLEFTPSETEALFGRCLGTPLGRAEVAALLEKTGGWAAGLVLFHCSLQGGNDARIGTRLAQLMGSNRYISQYLEENIFDAQPGEIRHFMLKTSLLSRLDTAFCDEFLQIGHSRHLLRRLSEHHLLTFPIDEKGNVYEYHHLLRDYLRAKLKDSVSGENLSRLHLSIARLLEKSGDSFEALTHFLRGNHFDEAERLLGLLEFRIMLEERLRFMRNCLDQFPDAIKRRAPRIQYLEARMCSLSGQPHQAIRWIKDALINFRKEGEKENIEKCLAELGSYYYYTGNIVEAERLLEQALEADIENPVIYIQVMTFLILFSAILGKIDRSDRHYQSAMDRLAVVDSEEKTLGTAVIDLAYSYRYFITGDFIKSQEINLKILELAGSRNAHMLLPLTYFQTAYTGFYLGRFAQGCEQARAGLSLAEIKGIQDSQTGWLHLSLGLNCLGLGNVPDAVDHGKQSLGIFQSHGNRWGMANAWELLHRVHLASGSDPEEAEQCLRKGLDAIEGRGLTVTEGILETGLAGILMEKGRYDPVPALLEKAQAKLIRSDYHTFRIRLLAARCHQACGREDTALECLGAGLETAKTHGYERFAAEEGKWIVPLLLRLYASGAAAGVIESVFGMAGDRFRNRLILLKKGEPQEIRGPASRILETLPSPPPPPLEIHLLGKFSVCRGGEEIPEHRWKSTKALMLFKYLAANRPRGWIHKEALIELLWPEEPYERTRKRFNVAVSVLRKLLEPGIQRAASCAYLIRKNDAFQLDTGEGGQVDTEAFSRELKLAERYEPTDPERSIRHYLKAETLYTGPFLAEDPYAEWCMTERDRLSEAFLRALSAIMRFREQNGDYAGGIRYAKKCLAENRYAEDIYRKLMYYRFMTGNLADVKKTYETCRKVLADELDCPLSGETMDLYCRLVQAE